MEGGKMKIVKMPDTAPLLAETVKSSVRRKSRKKTFPAGILKTARVIPTTSPTIPKSKRSTVVNLNRRSHKLKTIRRKLKSMSEKEKRKLSKLGPKAPINLVDAVVEGGMVAGMIPV